MERPDPSGRAISFWPAQRQQLLEMTLFNCVQNDLCSTEPKQMVDQHQVISIIATAIGECFKERPEQKNRSGGSEAGS